MLSLTGTDSVANYQQVLRSITYNNSSDSPDTTSRLITVQVNDSFVSSNLATATILINAVNDAPVLDNTGAMAFISITEDQTSNSGQTVASIISSAGGDRVTDADSGAVEGIAITAATNGNGAWQYSTDGGSTWVDVGTVSNNAALLLRSTDLVRFTPNGQNATTGDLTFRAWDQTSGSFGSKVDTSINGGTTAFSTATEVASIAVTAVNDAIGPLSDTNAATNTVAENAAIGTVVGITALATDVDNSDMITYSLDFNAGGRYAINSSTGVVTVSGALNAENQFLETIVVRATSSDGSSATQAYFITVTNVNEAPHDIRIPVTVASENFESGATGWSNNQTISGGGSLTNYLGGWGSEMLETQVFKDFALSGSQSSVTITFDMYEIDTWDGEAFKVWIDGVEYSSQNLWLDLYSEMYSGRENELGITQQITDGLTSLGGIPGFEDEIRRYSFTINTTSTNIRLGFSSTLNEAGGNEHWGVDNLNIVENRPELSISENSSNTAIVGTVQGYDVDAGTTLSYSLTDTAGGRFAIDASTGAITVANGSLLNFEAAASHNVTVQISDGSLSYSEVVTINLTNVNEGPAASTDTATAVEAGGPSNGTAGTNPTGNVLTNDTDVDSGDTKTVTGVAAGLQLSATGFVASNVTGNYGTISIAADGSYTYTVDNNNAAVQALRNSSQTLQDVYTYTMRDMAGLSSTTQITVTIQGANDTPYDITSGALAVNENATNGASVGSVTGLDVDSAANGEVFSYSLTNNAGGRFAINSSTGQITVANGTLLNREANTSHLVTIRVTDASGASFDKDFSIAINDFDEFDVTAISDTNAAINSVAENAANGTLVGITASASDADATTNTVTYTLDNSAGGRFAIDSATGVVTVADGSLLNYEAATSHGIVVRATSADGSISVQNYTIQITDVNESAISAISDADNAADLS